MKASLIRFTCDNCGKTGDYTEKFPYEQDWVYLYNFNAQIKSKNKSKEMDRVEGKDKHFCCLGCLSTFVEESMTTCEK